MCLLGLGQELVGAWGHRRHLIRGRKQFSRRSLGLIGSRSRGGDLSRLLFDRVLQVLLLLLLVLKKLINLILVILFTFEVLS